MFEAIAGLYGSSPCLFKLWLFCNMHVVQVLYCCLKLFQITHVFVGSQKLSDDSSLQMVMEDFTLVFLHMKSLVFIPIWLNRGLPSQSSWRFCSFVIKCIVCPNLINCTWPNHGFNCNCTG